MNNDSLPREAVIIQNGRQGRRPFEAQWQGFAPHPTRKTFFKKFFLTFQKLLSCQRVM